MHKFKRVDPRTLKRIAREIRRVEKSYGKVAARIKELANEIGKDERQAWNYLRAGRALLGYNCGPSR